jgi:hypothetical protein
MGEQNIVLHTDMYVHSGQKQQTKGVRGFLEGKTGLDRVCYGGLRGSDGSTGTEGMLT